MKGLASRAAKPELNPELKKGGKTDWSKITFGGKKVYALIDEIKAAMSSERLAREKYPSIFKYYDGLIGTKISHSVHPAGIVISPIDLISNYGVFEKDGENVMMIDMEEIHEVGLAKYDFLILKNVEIIQDIFKAIGKPYPRSDEIDWDDQNVWEDMLKSPAGILQNEGEFCVKNN